MEGWPNYAGLRQGPPWIWTSARLADLQAVGRLDLFIFSANRCLSFLISEEKMYS